MKRSSSFVPRFIALAAALLALPAHAQETDGPAPTPTPGEPLNPWQAPAPSKSDAAAAPTTPPSAGAPEPAKDSDETPGVEPPKPSPALIFLQSRREASAARDKQRKDQQQLDEPDDGTLGHHQDHWIGLVGARVGKMTSSGFDPFADSDELAQFSLGFGRTIVSAGNLSLAGLFLWDVGGRSGTARGVTSDLIVHRLTFGAEGRYHFFRQLFMFARVAPGALHSIATLEDDLASVENRGARNWVFATDLSGGAMFELTGFGRSRKRLPSAWIALDGGYGFAGESELSLTPDTPGDGPERGEPVNLGPMALRGAFLRGAVVVTY